jgi:hypothetical protein
LGQGKKIDPAIKKGMTWLVQTVDNMWGKLSVRVQKDVTDKQERDALEKAEKREKVRKMREERYKILKMKLFSLTIICGQIH